MLSVTEELRDWMAYTPIPLYLTLFIPTTHRPHPIPNSSMVGMEWCVGWFESPSVSDPCITSVSVSTICFALVFRCLLYVDSALVFLAWLCSGSHSLNAQLYWLQLYLTHCKHEEGNLENYNKFVTIVHISAFTSKCIPVKARKWKSVCWKKEELVSFKNDKVLSFMSAARVGWYWKSWVRMFVNFLCQSSEIGGKSQS